jgi:hypothetical protein
MSIFYNFISKSRLEYKLKNEINNFNLKEALKINLYLIKKKGFKPHLTARLIQIYKLNNNIEQISYTLKFIKKRGLINENFKKELKKLKNLCLHNN